MMMEEYDKENLDIDTATTAKRNGSGRQTLEEHLLTASARNYLHQKNGEQMISRNFRNLGGAKSNAFLLGFKGNSSNNLYDGLASHPRAYPCGSCKPKNSSQKSVCFAESCKSEGPSKSSPIARELGHKRRKKSLWEPVLLPIPE